MPILFLFFHFPGTEMKVLNYQWNVFLLHFWNITPQFSPKFYVNLLSIVLTHSHSYVQTKNLSRFDPHFLLFKSLNYWGKTDARPISVSDRNVNNLQKNFSFSPFPFFRFRVFLKEGGRFLNVVCFVIVIEFVSVSRESTMSLSCWERGWDVHLSQLGWDLK